MILQLTLALVALDAGIGLPPWPLSPDGDRVAVFVDAPLEAEGATVARESERLWTVLPGPGRETITLRAGAATATVPVGPAEGSIRISFDPKEPLKGRDRSVRVRFEVLDGGGDPLVPLGAPLVTVSAGRLGALVPQDGRGVFEAEWQPSEAPQPEVLGLVAIAPRCPLCATPLASGVARLPVPAAIELPGTSDPGVLTSVEIAGRRWGPVRADAAGRFLLPVVVPPGARWALATSQSALGNERRSTLDLGLTESPGLVCGGWPERLPADGRTEAGILCTTWNAAGGRTELRLRGSVESGALSIEPLDGGSWRARFRPPRGRPGRERVRLEVAPGARSDLPIELAPGGPASIEWRSEGEPATPGGRIRASARVLDVRGDLLGEALVDGTALAGDRFEVRSSLGDGAQPVRLSWTSPAGGAPATLSLGWADGRWLARVRDAADRPVEGVRLTFASGASAVTDAHGEAGASAKGETDSVVGPSGLRAAGWAAAGVSPSAIAIERTVSVALRPAGTFDVEAVLEGSWIRWCVRGPDGAVLSGRRVAIRASGVALGPAERFEGGGRCGVRGGKGTVAIEDSESGATALLEIR